MTFRRSCASRLINSCCLLLLLTGCSQGMTSFMKAKRAALPQKAKLKYDLPVVMNDEVARWVDYFTTTNRDRFGLYLSRSGRYEKMMRQILAEEDVPQDLIYLAMIESGFSDRAYSRARASGPWQFMRPTGRLYGLNVNWWQDERRDPEKATRAAANYLRNLHDEFGDWYLAMAAYNAGEGKIRRAVAQSGSRDFWQIASHHHRYLKLETKNYVPKFLAAMIIAKNPKRYGFTDIEYQKPYRYDTANIEGPIDLDVAADLIKTDPEALRELNPELNNKVIPALRYSLKVPKGMGDEFLVAYAELPPEKRIQVLVHTVRRGDVIGKIAKRYGVSSQTILAANHLSTKSGRNLHVGQTLVIPGKYSGRGSTATVASVSGLRTKKNGVEYLIQKEFTGASEEEQSEVALTPADAVVEPTPVQPVHIVRRGENLWGIAKKHGVTISDLRDWNKLTKATRLKPGRKLLLQAPDGI